MPTQVDVEAALDLVRELKPVPVGFCAAIASERELRAYGLPVRPDAGKHPHQAALWDRFAARSLEFVRPDLTPFDRASG
jgi:hypothetical protein